MTGFQLHDTGTEEILGSVFITKAKEEQFASEQELREGWEDFNKLEETECDYTNVDEFIVWFNENYETQIERLYLDYIQP